MELSLEEKKILLEAARKSIQSLFSKEKIKQPDYKKYPELNLQAGAFVTLTIAGTLRGCIGYVLSDQSMYDTVCSAAVQAAEFDPRFLPVRKNEVDVLSIEISILSRPFPLDNYEDIELGKHGLILEESGKRGLLLPQVPIEHNLDKEQFLDAICKKAGFPEKYWKIKKLKLKAFTALVFSEDDLE